MTTFTQALHTRRGARRAFDNDNSALVPEIWSQFGLAVLASNMTASGLVFRAFEDELAEYGDVVNTRRPQGFSAKRKTDADPVSVQDAKLTNIPVTLNQHLHVSFIIKDGEASTSMKNLIVTHLVPAMTAMAEQLDRIVLGQYPQFLAKSQAGTVNGLTNTNAKDYILELSQRMDSTKAPMQGRNLIVPPSMKTKILGQQIFTDAAQRGDQGTALREASLGRMLGFDAYNCQNMAAVAGGDTTTTFRINGGNLGKGSTVLTVGTGTGIIATGAYVSIAGDGKLHQVTAHSETLGNTTQITISPPLFSAILTAAVVTQGGVGEVDLIAGYAAGYASTIILDDFSVFPFVGTALTFGTDVANVYTVIESNSTAKTVLLDRPLVLALADEDVVNTVSGVSDFGLGFTQNAIALVVRPLALPESGVGAKAGIAKSDDFALRTVITYDGNKQGHLVTIDCLLGIAVLDVNCGAVLLG